MPSRRYSAGSLHNLGAAARPPPIIRPGDEMNSPFMFNAHFPPPSIDRVRPAQSLPGQRAQARADQSHRVNTSEEKKVLGLVKATFGTPSLRSDSSTEQEEFARRKLQTMLSNMTSDPAFANVDLGNLLNNTSWTVKTKNENPEY